MTHPRLVVVRGSNRQLFDTDFDPELADDQFRFEPDSGLGLDGESLEVGSSGGTPLASAPTNPNQIGLKGVGITRANLTESPQYTFTSSDNGRVITDRKFSSQVLINGTNGLTFRRCWLGASSGGGSYALLKQTGATGTNMLFEDCDFGAHGSGAWKDNGVGFLSVATYRRCLFYNFADCIKLGHLGTTRLEDCWLQPILVGTKHTDGIQFNDSHWGKAFFLRTTVEMRTWAKVSDGAVCHSQEELTQAVVRAVIAGNSPNAVFQSKPCGTPGACNGVSKPESFYSWLDSLITSGIFICTCEDQNGEFKRNIVIRNSARGSDLGLRNRTNIDLPTSGVDRSQFHDNGATYFGGAVGTGADPGPIHLLGLG